MKSNNKKILLKGEGANQHTLYGKFKVADVINDFADVAVQEESVLRHEQPDGSFGEHNALKVLPGGWVMGKQVEYNPFKREITQIWD